MEPGSWRAPSTSCRPRRGRSRGASSTAQGRGPKAAPHGWIDAARRGVPPSVQRAAAPSRRRATGLVIAVAAALVLALALKQGLDARREAAAPGSLAGLHGADEARL